MSCDPSKKRKNGAKPLHASIVFVQGTNRSNGLARWVLQQAICKIFNVDMAVVKKFKEDVLTSGLSSLRAAWRRTPIM